MNIWGIHKKYPSLSWWENFTGGFISFGNITIFGANAMRWTLQIRTKKWGIVCITLPVAARWTTRRDGTRYWHWYIYCSPNGTPWAATYYIGSNRKEHIRAKIRKLNFGHNFDTDQQYQKLRALNDKFDCLQIHQWDVEKYGNNEE
jgi:hypothetical protein